jgi:phosphate transport system substrate-binding protein
MGVKSNATKGVNNVNRKLIVLAIAAVASLSVTAVAVANVQKRSAGALSGAGSSFVFPLISTWAPLYQSATGTHIDYNPIGSGGGIQAIQNRTVDFGASDAPLSTDQFNACKGCVQIPWALSATSVMYNLDGAPPHLKVTGKVLADIFLGKVTSWNSPALKKLNPGVNLPAEKITPIFRSDGSGTTFNFTDYLSHVSGTFAQKVGTGTQVNFPVGVGGRGSSGISAVLARTNGGIAYADVAYALKNHFKFFAVQNKAGKYQLPGLLQIAAAAATVKFIPADNSLSIVDPAKSAKSAYPISTYTYVILPKKTDRAADLKKFVSWALTTGQKAGPKLLFQPIPKMVLTRAKATLAQVKS